MPQHHPEPVAVCRLDDDGQLVGLEGVGLPHDEPTDVVTPGSTVIVEIVAAPADLAVPIPAVLANEPTRAVDSGQVGQAQLRGGIEVVVVVGGAGHGAPILCWTVFDGFLV